METQLENILTHFHKAEMIDLIKRQPNHFQELIHLMLEDRQPYSWRASWLLWSVMEKNDSRLKPYLQAMLDSLPHRKGNQQRELLMILQRMTLDPDQEGMLFDFCRKIWEKRDSQPSIRFNAFRFMFQVAKKHPDLMMEIRFLTQPHFLEPLSKGVRWSVSKLMQQIPS